MTVQAIQVKAAREAGYVRRCHVVRASEIPNVAEHTYNMLAMLLLLHPNPSLKLVRAVTFHDLPERWTGDVPATAKSNPAVDAALASMEARVYRALQISWGLGLDDEDLAWLGGLDKLEFWLWCRDHPGPHVDQMRVAYEDLLRVLHDEGQIPERLWDHYVEHSTAPPVLPDKLDELEKLRGDVES